MDTSECVDMVSSSGEEDIRKQMLKCMHIYEGACFHDNMIFSINKIPQVRRNMILSMRYEDLSVRHIYFPSHKKQRAPICCTWNYAFAVTERMLRDERLYTIYALPLSQTEYDSPSRAVEQNRKYRTPWLWFSEEIKNVITCFAHGTFICVITKKSMQVFDVDNDWSYVYGRKQQFDKSTIFHAMNSAYIAIWQNGVMHLYNYIYNYNLERKKKNALMNGEPFKINDQEVKPVKKNLYMTVPVVNITAVSLSEESFGGEFNLLAVFLKYNFKPKEAQDEEIKGILYFYNIDELLDGKIIKEEGKYNITFDVDRIVFDKFWMCLINTKEGKAFMVINKNNKFLVCKLEQPIVSVCNMSSSGVTLVQDKMHNIYAYDIKEKEFIKTIQSNVITSGERCMRIDDYYYSSIRMFSDRFFVLLPDCSVTVVCPKKRHFPSL